MTPQQYERLTELFHAALEIAPDERVAFLDHVSETDMDLRPELESLLSAQSAAFTEKPPDDIAAGYLAQQGGSFTDAPSLALNTRFDHYEIRSLLGKGGMGEVYLAEDVRLHRNVALKILPRAVASNQDRMRRFEQEATAAAALNHPNIAHIYEIGESDGIHFIAIEHIDGVTLRAKIHREKAPLQKLLRYLYQVAEGLSKAHAAGIVHRDLKPDNIMVTRDDYAKILDFGLAKPIGPPAVQSSRSEFAGELSIPVTAQHSMAGMVMGTAGYMSPEQAQGKTDQIDHRSDIFSFGCILFEVATGRRPFADDSIVKSLHKVTHEEAPLIASFNPEVPADLQRIVRVCLEKDREKRYQSIQEVGRELNEVIRGMATSAEINGAVQPSGGAHFDIAGRQTDEQSANLTANAEYIRSSIKKPAIIAVVVGSIAIAIFVWLLWQKGRTRPSSARLVTVKRLTPDIYARDPTLSPKGEYLAYVKREKNYTSIWIKDMASGKAVQTMPPSLEGYGGVQFSPDSQQMYYLTNHKNTPNGTIVRIPAWGGTPQDIAGNSFSNFAISPDGQQLAFVRSATVVVADAEGKGERDLFTLPSSAERFVAWGSQVSWSPDGAHIAVCGELNEQGRNHAELLVVSVIDGSRQILPIPNWTGIDDAAWLNDGASILVTAREKEGDSQQIWRVAYPGGETTRVTNDSNSYEGLSLTADSRTLVAEQYYSHKNIWLASLSDTKNAQRLTTSTIAFDGEAGVEFGPDDSIIFTSPRTGNVDLWRMNYDGSSQQPLTENVGSFNTNPRLTADGQHIVFASSRTGAKHIWRMDTNGQNPVQLTDGPNAEDRPYLSPDGQWVYYSTVMDQRPAVMKVSISGGNVVRISGDLTTWDAVPSPDGKLLACGVYLENSEKPWKVAILSSEGGPPLKLLDTLAYRDIKHWTDDSKSFIYINGSTAELWQQPIDGRPSTKLFTLSNERLYNFAFSRDFQKIAYSLGNESSEAVLISNFASE